MTFIEAVYNYKPKVGGPQLIQTSSKDLDLENPILLSEMQPIYLYREQLRALGYNLLSDGLDIGFFISEDSIADGLICYLDAYLCFKKESKKRKAAVILFEIPLSSELTSGVAVSLDSTKSSLIDAKSDILTRSDLHYSVFRVLEASLRAASPSVERFDSLVQDPTLVVEGIADLYESFLKYSPQQDFWYSSRPDQGRNLFSKQVASFVSLNEPIQMVLPAFPCKSPNREKTSGELPDLGEEFAICTFLNFIFAVEAIYFPGCKLHIVSDGHVFSDLIGVDDSVVGAYHDALVAMTKAIDPLSDSHFQFYRLDELLDIPDLETSFSISSDKFSYFKALSNLDSEIVYDSNQLEPISQIDPLANLYREVLSRFYGHLEMASLKESIKSDPNIAKMYHGFSKFVYEDLKSHPSRKGTSNKAQKKLAAQIALHMLLRNDAYSRLVQFEFPRAIRLSIHPHDNSGPKFGIRTIHSNYVLAQTDGVAAGMAEKFHSPTPWHSCILRLSEDGKHFFLSAKASEVRKYGAEKGKEAKFFPSNCGEGRGGFFYFGELESPAS